MVSPMTTTPVAPPADTRRQWISLRVIRERNGDSLTSLSKRSGVSLSYLSQLENGDRDPTPAATKKLAMALNVPLSIIEKERRIALSEDVYARVLAELGVDDTNAPWWLVVKDAS